MSQEVSWMDLKSWMLWVTMLLSTIVIALVVHYLLRGATWKKDETESLEVKGLEKDTAQGQEKGEPTESKGTPRQELHGKRRRTQIKNRKRRQKRKEAKEIAAIQIEGEGIRF